MVIWETFKVAECRAFLLCTHVWYSRIKTYIAVVLWRNSCSLHQTVIQAPNQLDRKTACNRFFCKISSSFYSWKVLCLIFPSSPLPIQIYTPFASFGGIFPSEKFSCFFLWFLKDVFYWLSSRNLTPDEDALLYFFHAHRVYCAWKLLSWMWRDSKSFSFFLSPSLFFPP